ncbi:hypothetical protein ACFGVR_04810 [Mucilaginibacter sp. AW1-3]|jgi:hypothetical protein
MNKLRASLHSRVHNWMNKIGFRLNSSDVIKKTGVKVDHYFFKTFNFIEQYKLENTEKPEFICFDTYGEKIKVRSLLDLQSAFFENLSELK